MSPRGSMVAVSPLGQPYSDLEARAPASSRGYGFASVITPTQSAGVRAMTRSPTSAKGGNLQQKKWKYLAGISLVAIAAVSGCAMFVFSKHDDNQTGLQSGQPAANNLASADSPDLQCITYSPFHHPQYESNVLAAIDDDFKQIKSSNFRCIKTYYSQYFGNNVGYLAAKYGMQAVIGVYYNSPFADVEIAHAIKACKELPSTILGIIVGSEDLPPMGSKSWQDIQAIVDRIRAGGCTKPIGTSQRLQEYLNQANPLGNLLNSLDFLGVTIYPFFSPGTDANDPAAMLKSQLNQLYSKYPALKSKFHITETGWPTAGSPSFGNQPSLDTARRYFNQFSEMACQGYFGGWSSYFIVYDEKTSTSPDVNQFFGIRYAGGVEKFPAPTICNDGASASSLISVEGSISILPTIGPQPSMDGWNVESNFDYPGNDMGNKRGQPGDCSIFCSTSYSCSGYVWTNYLGGTCWLKSLMTGKIYLAGAIAASKVSVPPSTPGWTFEDGMDYTGNDLEGIPGRAIDCAGQCVKLSKCAGFTWSAYAGGMCWLKSAMTNKVSKPGVISGVQISASSSSEWEFANDVDYVGNDLSSIRGAVDSCPDTCKSTTNCRAFTWSAFNGGTCFLKSAAGNTISRPGARSARRTGDSSLPTMAPASNAGFACVGNVDLFGNDISKESGQVTACQTRCATISGCKAFTWTSWNGGTCFFKSGFNVRNSVSGATSCAVLTSKTGRDLAGGDLSSAKGQVGDCGAVCLRTASCRAYTWNNHLGGTCWLKAGSQNEVTANAATSGLLG